MPKRPDYGDATPEDLAIALMRFQRPPLKKPPEPDKEQKKEKTKPSADRREQPGFSTHEEVS